MFDLKNAIHSGNVILLLRQHLLMLANSLDESQPQGKSLDSSQRAMFRWFRIKVILSLNHINNRTVFEVDP